LVFVEAVLNQPYSFFIRKVNIYRFQFYQMLTDIIVISWVIYYMGGIEAPLISIAYYAVILWAGVVSGPQAAFFAVTASCIFFSSVVVLNHFGILPSMTYLHYEMPTVQMLSLLLGNVSFLFAFGYFSARSSQVIKFLERKRQEESLRHTHKLLSTGYLVGAISHDIINYLISIRGYVKILLEKINRDSEENEKLKSIERLEGRSTELLYKLAKFSQKPKEEFKPTDLNKTIEDAVGLTLPLARMSGIIVENKLEPNLPLIMADRDQLQEVFVALIFNSIDTISKKGRITIKTHYPKRNDYVEVVFSDTGIGIKQEHLNRIVEPFFTTKTSGKALGLGLTLAYEVVERHRGKIELESRPGEGIAFTILLPVK
jgi:signal transduction histidine kinase